MDSIELFIEKYLTKTKEILPESWKKGRNCPECNVNAEIQKCMWDFGPSCPRHDPYSYSDNVFIEVADKESVKVGKALLLMYNKLSSTPDNAIVLKELERIIDEK